MSTSGILLIDKPAGKTSHDVVAEVRRQLRRTKAVSGQVSLLSDGCKPAPGFDAASSTTKNSLSLLPPSQGSKLPREPIPKVGHAGTLDPFATGLLIVLVGKATRLQRFFMELPKTYEVVARLGYRSTTGDTEGEIEYTGQCPGEPLVLPTGRILQSPPAYSAIKVDGERAYKKARRGETVEIPPRTVELYRFEQLSRAGNEARFVVECSAGTYIRSLIADLGDAYCLELRRTAIGHLDVTGASSDKLVPLRTALQFMPQYEVTAAQANDLIHGRSISLLVEVKGDAPFCLVTQTDVVAIGKIIGANIKPTIVLAEQ